MHEINRLRYLHEKNHFYRTMSSLANKEPAFSGDDGVDGPVMIRHGDFFGRGKHLLLETEGNYGSG